MNFNFVDYCQYLLKSHTNFTITNLANHLENISHDKINRYLRTEFLNSEDLWRNVEEMMLNAINNKKIPFKTVLIDSWYATERLMALIDNLGKFIIFS